MLPRVLTSKGNTPQTRLARLHFANAAIPVSQVRNVLTDVNGRGPPALPADVIWQCDECWLNRVGPVLKKTLELLYLACKWRDPRSSSSPPDKEIRGYCGTSRNGNLLSNYLPPFRPLLYGPHL